MLGTGFPNWLISEFKQFLHAFLSAEDPNDFESIVWGIESKTQEEVAAYYQVFL